MVQLVPVTTTRLGEHLPLLDLLPDTQPLAWVRSGEGLVGERMQQRQLVAPIDLLMRVTGGKSS
jgi:menaquinone-specific isochorismate synthase